METANLISKKQIREVYESYTDYFNEIMAKVIERLQQNIKLSAQPTYKSRVKSFESYFKKILRLKPEQMEETKSLIYLTDMMGIRMICAFLEDINLGVEQIKKLFEIKFAVSIDYCLLKLKKIRPGKLPFTNNFQGVGTNYLS